MSSIKTEFISYLQHHLQINKLDSNINLDLLISDNLLSPFILNLNISVLDQIKNEIKLYNELKKWSFDNLLSIYQQKELPINNGDNLCTSFDFHLNQKNELKLIEVNTNAAFLGLGTYLNLFLKNKFNKSHINNSTEKSVDWQNFSEADLFEMFVNEIKKLNCNKNKIYILDEQPEQQRLYIEFLLFKSLLNKYNIECEIIDISQIDKVEIGSLIYNRYTDFYLNDDKSKLLKKLFQENKISLSPSPLEYFLIADKQRMYDWNNQKIYSIPKSLLKIYNLNQANQDEIWTNRKNLFFKPANSFGSKQVYKGQSLSRKVFENAIVQNFIAQELAPPSEVNVFLNEANLAFKYDLRCYVYAGELQLVVARLYQGQTTNLQTFGGGFATVRFNLPDFDSSNQLQNTDWQQSSSTHYTSINQ